MALWAGFIGPSYTMRSASLDAEMTMNLFAERIQSNGDAKQWVMYGTPGLVSQVTASDVVGRGMFAQDGRQFIVIGPSLYEMTVMISGILVTKRGTVANDGLPVYFASNGQGGNQLVFTSAATLYAYNLSTNTLTTPTWPGTNAPGMVVFLNSYFLANETNSLKVWFSENEDGTTWNALDFFARSNTSDNVVGIAVLHDMIHVFGSKTREVFYDAGEADNPFLPYPGSVSMDGAVTSTAIATLRETTIWLSRNAWNVVQVMQVGIGEATVISTPPIEFAFAGYSTVTDCEILTYEQEGHTFAAFTFPTADATWVYDLREQQWHQRSRWDGTVHHRWRARGSCAPGKQVVLVGDYLTGDIYTLSLDTFSDNCATVKRVRRAPYLSAENQWMFLDQVELGMQSGVGTGPNTTGVNANVQLRISRDSGVSYTSPLTASMGTQNSTLARAIWRRLGRVRSDRLVLEVSMTDPVRCVWGPGLWVRGAAGSGTL